MLQRTISRLLRPLQAASGSITLNSTPRALQPSTTAALRVPGEGYRRTFSVHVQSGGEGAVGDYQPQNVSSSLRPANMMHRGIMIRVAGSICVTSINRPNMPLPAYLNRDKRTSTVWRKNRTLSTQVPRLLLTIHVHINLHHSCIASTAAAQPRTLEAESADALDPVVMMSIQHTGIQSASTLTPFSTARPCPQFSFYPVS